MKKILLALVICVAHLSLATLLLLILLELPNVGKQKEKEPRYEYIIESVDKSDCPNDYIRCIDNHGKHGWKLHTVDITLGVAIYERERR